MEGSCMYKIVIYAKICRNKWRGKYNEEEEEEVNIHGRCLS